MLRQEAQITHENNEFNFLSQVFNMIFSNEESGGDAQAGYPPGVVGMERGQEKGTGGRDPWIRTGIGV
jgi:hypothetical protein